MHRRRADEPVFKILIVKLSSLGDVVHAMPAVQDIRRAMPRAQIDWVVERAFAPLVWRCKGVHRVIECEQRRWRKSWWTTKTHEEWIAFKTELRRESYDAVIDLQGLTKSAWVAWLAHKTASGKRFGLANRTEGSGFEAPARWVADVALRMPTHSHAVMRSRAMCAQALGYELPTNERFGLIAHVEHGFVAIKNKEASPLGVVALIHGTSRADKEWPLAHWQALGALLNDAGYGVALVHGSAAEQQRSFEIAKPLRHVQVWPRLGLDQLTDSLATCAGVIGVDSGLSHIAVALNLPHVQLYNFDTAWRTGPPPSAPALQRSVFARPAPSVATVWRAWQDVCASAHGA